MGSRLRGGRLGSRDGEKQRPIVEPGFTELGDPFLRLWIAQECRQLTRLDNVRIAHLRWISDRNYERAPQTLVTLHHCLHAVVGNLSADKRDAANERVRPLPCCDLQHL